MRNKLPLFVFVISSVFAMFFVPGRLGAEVKEVFLTPHFHYDPVFVKDQNDYTDVGFDRVRRFLDALKQDPDYHVVFSEIDYLKPFFDTFPEERDVFLRLVAENRIETGGSYNEPNEMSIGGEGLIRNIVYGRAYHEGTLGDRNAGVYMPLDVFGHTLQLSQILKKTRYEGAVWRKGNPPTEKWVGITVPGLPPDFISLAPDGSTLHHRREHYKALSNTVSADDLIAQVDKKKRLQDSLGLAADFGLLSSGDFAFPEPWLAGQAGSLKKNDPPIYISGPSAYFRAIKKQMGEGGGFDVAALPEVARDFSLYHVGTALSRTDLKIGNRLSETALLNAEKFGTIAALLGAWYPEPAIDKAWRQVLFNQHHDAITGTCCDRCFFDLLQGYREALGLSTEANLYALDYIVSKIDFNKELRALPVVVFNPLGWTRTDIVTLETSLPEIFSASPHITNSEGHPIPFDIVPSRAGPTQKGVTYTFRFVAKDVPPMGYKTYYISGGSLKKQAEAAPLVAKGNTIENKFYSVTVDPSRGGTITRLVDKETGFVVIDPSTEYPGNELIILKEDNGSPWELSTAGIKGMSSRQTATVSVEKGDTQVRLIINGEIPSLGKYKQEIRLYPGIKRIDFQTTIIDPAGTDNDADRNLWLVRFPAALHGTAPIVEDRFFAAARRRSLKPLQYRTEVEKSSTLSAPYSAANWVEEGTAVRVFIHDNGGKVVDALSIQLCEIIHSRSAESIAAAQLLQRALIQRGVTCTPSFDDEDRSKDLLNRNFRFVINIGGDNAFAESLVSKTPACADYRERLKKDGTARLLMSAPTEDLEISKVDTLILGSVDAAAMKRMAGELADSITSHMRIDLKTAEDARGEKPHPPDDYGIALINRGTLLHSFDSNGTIVMGLFHSAPWADTQMGVPFAFPEEKNTRFEYSLYPHGGDWRDARTYRVGQEVNNPLTAFIRNGHIEKRPSSSAGAKPNGIKLPAEMSFFDITSGSAVLTTIKPAGNPLASMKTGAVPGPQNGVVMRFYEAEGKSDKVKIKFFEQINSARRANLLEEKTNDEPVKVTNGNTVEFEIGPNAIETIIVDFKDAAASTLQTTRLKSAIDPMGSSYLADGSQIDNRNIRSESSDYLFSNYWELNRGAAYMYNAPVSVNVDFPPEKKLPDPALLKMNVKGKPKTKKIKQGNNRLRLAVSNNSVDEKLQGELAIEVPSGWKAAPDRLALNLAPLEGRVIDLSVSADVPIESGYIRATVKKGETSYFDTLRVGKAAELETAVNIEPQKTAEGCSILTLRIRNNQGGRIDGSAEPIGPIETLPVELVGEFSLVSVAPGYKAYSLEAGAEEALQFNICRSDMEIKNARFWLVMKITYNGDFKYIPLVLTGSPDVSLQLHTIGAGNEPPKTKEATGDG